jgi:mRNA interferase RelE/StbE
LPRVALTGPARRDLDRLDWRISDAVAEAVALLGREPDAGHPLQGRLAGLLSLRVGAYRILYHLTDDDHTVRVVAIRHRSMAYRVDPR